MLLQRFMISDFLELRPKLLLYLLTTRSQNHMRNFLKSYWSSYSKDTVPVVPEYQACTGNKQPCTQCMGVTAKISWPAFGPVAQRSGKTLDRQALPLLPPMADATTATTSRPRRNLRCAAAAGVVSVPRSS